MSHAVHHFVGLDLGQASDYSALVVLERPHGRPGDPGKPAYAARRLHRFPLGTPYPEVVSQVRTLLKTPPLPGCVLVVDQTGVGRAVVDMLAEGLRDQVTCKFCPVTITAGHAVTAAAAGPGMHLPKKDLVGVLQVLLQTRRLHVARSLPDAGTLVNEMEGFRVRITAARNGVYEAWREGVHDDLVLATALAGWVGEQALLAEAEPEDDEPVFTPIRIG